MPLYLGETQIEGLMVKGEGGGGSPVIEELDVAAAGTYAAGSGVDGYSPVVVPAGTAGTPSASKGNVSNNSVQVTPSVTNSAGFIAGGTKNGTAVTVQASELVSGTKSITTSGETDVTNYQKASVAAGSEGTPTASKGTVSNNSVAVTPSVTNTAGLISGGTKSGTPVTVFASELVSGKKEITSNGDDIDVTNFEKVKVAVSASAGAKVATATKTLVSAASSIQFTDLLGEPTSFAVVSATNLATGASPYKAAAVVFDGTNIIGQYITNTSNAQMTYSASAFSMSYSNGTLTITCSGANFQANQYKLVYSYDGSSANIGTADVQVGSGATSITFTGLPEEPTCWSCIFKTDIGTSSGYTRAHVVVNDGSSIYGMEMGSGSSATSNWTATYNNGSLTITSSSTSAGGYFHQPGYYQLTYVIGGEVNIDIEPLEVTQNGTYSESGKAYSPVTVNVSSSGGANFGTVTTTNSSNQNTSISFTLPAGRTPKAFFVRLTSQIARNSSSRYYYVYDMRWDGSSSGGVAGNTFYMYNGTLTDVTSGYSYSQSGTTFTLSSTGSRSASPGSFFNGTYEMVYVY